jgi:hypothetical protein
MTMAPTPPFSESGNVVMALQAFIALILILVGATATIIFFISRIGNKINEAKNHVFNEVKKTEMNLLEAINNAEKNLDKKGSGIEAKLDGQTEKK